MSQCTFKPKLNAKEFLMRKKSEKLKSKISKSLSPHRMWLNDQFDMSVLNKWRLRVERQDEDNCIDQISPQNWPPSNDNSKTFEISAILNKNEKNKQADNSTTFRKMIKKSEEVVLNLSKSPSFQHNLIPNKRVKKNLKDKLSCSIASKR